MRKRRSEEEIIAEQEPVMYHSSQLCLVNGIRSSFPKWPKSGFFEWRNGWTRMGDYFAEGYFLPEQMSELVHNRFGVSI